MCARERERETAKRREKRRKGNRDGKQRAKAEERGRASLVAPQTNDTYYCARALYIRIGNNRSAPDSVHLNTSVYVCASGCVGERSLETHYTPYIIDMRLQP